MTRVSGLNPQIFVWAREQAGLDLEEAARRAGFQSSAKSTAEQKLSAIEQGVSDPTRAQLDNLAEVYRRPLTTFYLKVPPITASKGEDFRSLADRLSRRENANVEALVRDIRARQELVKDILEAEDDVERVSLVGSRLMNQGVESVVSHISQFLAIDHTDRALRKGGAALFFKMLRSACESRGIFVILAGDLGSHHSAISTKAFRGFVISDEIAPFVVINDQDSKAAWSFSLLHELAHLCMGQTGISSETSLGGTATSTDKIERFCDDVASKFLLPDSAIVAPAQQIRSDVQKIAAVIAGTAELWAISEAMVSYRFWRNNWISDTVAGELFGIFARRWFDYKAKKKQENKEREGGPSFFLIRQSKVGNALISFVQRNLYDNVLTPSKAAKVLGVNVGNVDPLIRQYEKSLYAGRNV